MLDIRSRRSCRIFETHVAARGIILTFAVCNTDRGVATLIWIGIAGRPHFTSRLVAGERCFMSAQPFIQPLESRQFLSAQLLASVYLTSKGTLQIHGTAAAEEISINTAAKGGKKVDITITRDGSSSTTRLDRSDIKRFTIEAGGGKDTVRVDQQLNVASTINGGAGNDRIFATGGTINGGAGDDYIDATGFINDPSNQLTTWVPVSEVATPAFTDQTGAFVYDIADPWRLSKSSEISPFVDVQGRASLLNGNDGNDTLIGSIQDDTMTGGRGSDAVFVRGDLNGEVGLENPTGGDEVASVERLRAFPSRLFYTFERTGSISDTIIVRNLIDS